MEGWMWLILASMFGVGGVLGYVLGRSKGDNHQKIRELENSLSERATELESYRAEVAQHFGKTAELFNKLTTDYREVYEHLAASSEALCGDQAAKLNAKVPDNKLLDAQSDEAPGKETEAVKEAKSTNAGEKEGETPQAEAEEKEEKASEEAARKVH